MYTNLFKPMIQKVLAEILRVHGINTWNVHIKLGNELVRIFDAGQMDAVALHNEYFDSEGNLLAVSTPDSYVVFESTKVSPYKGKMSFWAMLKSKISITFSSKFAS